MSETKHLNTSSEQISIERYVFLEEYHKDQDIDAPFEKSEATKRGFSFMFITRKLKLIFSTRKNFKIFCVLEMQSISMSLVKFSFR